MTLLFYALVNNLRKLLFVLIVFTLVGFTPHVLAQQTPYREVKALDWSFDSTKIAIGYHDGTVEIRDLKTEETNLNSDATTGIADLAWHPSDSSKLIIAFKIGILWLWDLNTDTILKVPLETDNLTSVDWSPDGTRIVTAENKSGERHPYNALAIRDGSTLDLLEEYTSDTELIFQVKWSPVEGDTRILSTSIDGKTHIWDVQTGEIIHKIFSPLGGYDVEWSPTGEQFITISGDEVLRVWDGVNYSVGNFPLADYTAQTFLVDVEWRPTEDSTQVAIIDGETIVIYDIHPCNGKDTCGTVLATIPTERVMNTVAWSSDDQLAYAGGGMTGVTIRQALSEPPSTPAVNSQERAD